VHGLPRSLHVHRGRDIAISGEDTPEETRDTLTTTPPKVQFDFEFHFASGAAAFFTAEEGRDKIAADEVRVRLELHPDPATTEEVIVSRAALAYMRTTRREIEPETQLHTDLGLAGTANALN